MYKTLVHGLREVDPQAAAMLESSPRLRKSHKAEHNGQDGGDQYEGELFIVLITACKAVYGRNAVAFVGAESITAPAMSRALVVCGVVTDLPQDCLQVSSFLMLDMLIYVWHQLPLIGRLAGPVTQFLSMLECMSMPQAVVLALLGCCGAAAVVDFSVCAPLEDQQGAPQNHTFDFPSRFVMQSAAPAAAII